ncbi:MAG: TRAP transporter fused permease subunit [Chloroflexi bacterium]|nr:TRAP transporter fused permease subunit [Chloroflexota bacterium]
MSFDANKILQKSGEAVGGGQIRQFSGPWRWIMSGLAIAFSIYILLYVGDVTEWVGLRLFGSHRALAYATVMLLVFLFIPARKGKVQDRVPWYDILLGLGGAAASLYVFWNWESQVESYATPSVVQMVLGALALLTTLEAARRTLGWALSILGAFFIVYTLYGNFFPGFMLTKGYSYSRMLGHYYLSGTGLYGSAMEIFTVVVAVYVIFAQFVQISGAGDFFFKLGLAVVGRFRGGPAKVAVFSSSLFGTVSGLAVANVVVDGGITIPMMKKTGYKPEVAAAVEASASNGGQIMPPVMGTAAFLMADMLGIPYWGVAAAAVLPALFYYVALYFMLDFEAAKTGLKGLPRVEIPPIWRTLKEGGVFLLPLGVLIYFIGVLDFSAQKSGLFALLALVAVSFIRKETRPGVRDILGALEKGAHSTAQLGPAAGAIGILMSAVTLTGLGVSLSSGLLQVAGGSLILLLILTAVAALIMGTAASTLLVYVILAMFVVPGVVKAGVDPLAAHMFVFYFGMISMVTPPVGLAAYAAAAVGGADYWKTGWQAARLSIVGFIVPFIFVFHPAMLFKGTAEEIALAGVSGVAGTIALAAAMIGYVFTTAHWWERILLGAGALLMMTPGWETDLIGIALISIAMVAQSRAFFANRRKATAAAPGYAGGGASSGDPPAALSSGHSDKSSKGIIQ